MAKTLGGIGQFLSGNIEGLVFVRRKGETYMRAMPRKRKASEWSERQKEARNGFSAVIQYARLQKKDMIVPIWNKAVKNMTMSGWNLFIKSNRAAFDALGQLHDPLKLHFSTGRLPLPEKIKAGTDTENPSQIAVSWTDQMAGTEYGYDSLMAVIYQDGANKVVDTGAKRWDCKATIENPTPEAEVVYLYLFFWNEKRDSYSPDQVFAITHS
jgi:hypothetical protein